MPYGTILHDLAAAGPVAGLVYALWAVVTGKPEWARAYWASAALAVALLAICVLLIGLVTLGLP